MEHPTRSFIPAAGHDLALPLYDPLTKLFGAEAVRRSLIEHARLHNGTRALDVGCGTGSLLVMAKQMCGTAELTGLDPDLRALQRASEKARRAGVSVRFDHGFADRLPYADASFDVVFSSLMFHHLHAPERTAMLREVRRVLKPGASLHLVDFATPLSGSRRILPRVLRFESRLQTSAGTGVVPMLRDAGFEDAREVDHDTLLLQDIVFYAGSRAAV